MQIWSSVEVSIANASGHSFSVQRKQSISGGSINRAYRIDDESGRERRSYFLKLNQANRLNMFEAEAEALLALASSGAIRVPQPLCSGQADDQAWLVTEYINFGRKRVDSTQLLGRQIAALHACESDGFGWKRDNTIGATAQLNSRSHDWIDFYREQRLGFQFQLASRNGFSGSLQQKGEQLMTHLDLFFSNYQPKASLLHGDLWSGNRAFDELGEPVVFDPALYYGDREADIAMTELFGGFGSEFYESYNDAWPLDEGYVIRKDLYNLYHILNHVNLFGASYAAQAESMLDRLLAEI